MKKTYIKPETEICPLFLEGSLLQATMHGTVDNGDPFGGGGGEGGPSIPADVRKFDLWADENE